MHKKLLLAILLNAALILPYTASAETRPTIAVLDFGFNNMHADTGKIIRNKIEYLLYNSGKLNILERNRVDLLKKENALSGIKTGTREYAIEAGKILPAEYVVTGSITYTGKYYVHVTAVDILSGSVIYSFDKDFESETDIYNRSGAIAKGIEDKICSMDSYRADPVKKDFYLSVSTGYIPAIFKAEDFSDGGFIISAEFGLRNILIHHLDAGMSAGYSHFYTDGDMNYASFLPLLVTSSYTLEFYIFGLSPGIGAGTSYIIIDKESGSRSAFEPCMKIYLNLDIMLNENIAFEFSSGYYSIYEPEGNIDFISFTAGIKTSI